MERQPIILFVYKRSVEANLINMRFSDIQTKYSVTYRIKMASICIVYGLICKQLFPIGIVFNYQLPFEIISVGAFISRYCARINILRNIYYVNHENRLKRLNINNLV